MPLPELSDTLGTKRAAHLLRRAAFGGTKQQIDTFAALTPAQAIQELYGRTLPDPALPIYPETGQEWITQTPADADNIDLENYFMGWFIAQMMSAGIDPALSLPYAARERLVYFLHTHFTTIKSKVSSAKALYYQNQLFRLFALDGATTTPDKNFKVLTVKVSVDNAMLRVLDGNLNVKGNPNENYAREFHELYTIGRGLETSVPPTGENDYYYYTEDDVKAGAKVFSGWDFDESFENIDPDTELPRGKVKGSPTSASAHNNDPKTFSARYGANATVTPDTTLMNGGNPTEESALDEITQLVDLIYANPETARNICRKIYRFFVWAPHTPDEMGPIDSTIILEMANTFAANGYKLQPVIENLLRSQHFYDAAVGLYADDNFGGIIKSPLDLVVGTYRFFEVELPDMASQAVEFYEHTNEILSILEDQAMKFYEPFDVSGYEAYCQYPVYHRFWITPNSLATRYNFIRQFVTASEPGMIKIDPLAYIRNNFSAVAGDSRELIIALATYLLPVPDRLTYDYDQDEPTDASLTAERMNYFKTHFLEVSGNADLEGYWTLTWSSGSTTELPPWLALLFNTMLQTPEYQLA